MKVACLTTLWWGVSIGGKHYTGKIHQSNEPFIELTRKLSRKEAKQIAEDNGCPIWQTETNRFNSLAQLERCATKWCEENLGDEWLLIYNDIHNPNIPIAGKGYIEASLPEMKSFAEWWDKVPDNRREKIWHSVYELWNELIRTPNISSA